MTERQGDVEIDEMLEASRDINERRHDEYLVRYKKRQFVRSEITGKEYWRTMDKLDAEGRIR